MPTVEQNNKTRLSKAKFEVQLHIRITEDLFARIQDIVVKNEMTVTEFARSAMRAACEAHENREII